MRAYGRPVAGFSFLTTYLVLGMLSAGLLPSAGFSQVAGPGTENPKNQPGYSAPPASAPDVPQESTDPQVKAILAQMAAAGILHPKTVDEWRKAYVYYTKFEGEPEKVFHIDNRSIPGPAGDIPIRVYSPRSGSGFPVWVFFHGGGFVTGSLDSHDAPLRAVTNRCGCLVVSVAYRLAPENPYPAAPNDAYAATKWVADHATEIGGDPGRIAVGGDGTGGNLAAVVTLMARDKGGPHLIYQLLVYPTLDFSMLTASRILANDPIFTTDAQLVMVGAYLPVGTDPEIPFVSPVYASSFKGLPPALIVTDADDPVRDEAERYSGELQMAGVPEQLIRYPNTIHGFFLLAGALDAGRKSIDQIGASLKQAFDGTPSN